MENDSVADSEEADPEASKMFDVPDPDTSRVVAPELIDPERRAQHRRWVLDRLERWIPLSAHDRGGSSARDRQIGVLRTASPRESFESNLSRSEPTRRCGPPY